MIRIAHLTDVHLDGVPSPKLIELLSKRVIGYINWRHNRAHSMTRDQLDELVADLKAQAPDHIAVTGDLTNIALPGEFENARNWLQSLGTERDVTAIPGNHDAYVPFADRYYRRLWAPWMRDERSPDAEKAGFPFLRTFRNIALIGLSTAVPTPPFMATGRLGTGQVNRLRALLQLTGEQGLFRLVLIHHPPRITSIHHWHRRLTDAGRFRRLIRQVGAELIIHGHDHVATTETIAGRHEPVPLIGAASASGPPGAGPKAGGYALYEIEPSDDGYRLTVIHRGFDETAAIIEKSRGNFSINAPRTTHR